MGVIGFCSTHIFYTISYVSPIHLWTRKRKWLDLLTTFEVNIILYTDNLICMVWIPTHIFSFTWKVELEAFYLLSKQFNSWFQYNIF